MRVRKVITRSGKRIRAKFPSTKLNRMVHCESPLERDAAYHFEYHPQVVSYQEQPSIEHYYDEAGEQHRYYPDFEINFKDGRTLLIEVKSSRSLAKKDVREQLKGVSCRLAEQGRAFRILTEADIRREPLFSNLKALHNANRKVTKLEAASTLYERIAGGISWLLGALIDRLKGKSKVLQLIHSNHLTVNLEKALTYDTVVHESNSNGGNQNGSYFI
jgi:TnsA endonuclease N terminal